MSDEIQESEHVSNVAVAQEEGEQRTATENDQQVSSEVEEKMIPLSVVQKERKKRQQLQQELDFLKNQSQQPPQQQQDDEYSKYESITRDDLKKSNSEMLRLIDERSWCSQHPEKHIYVENELENFLKQRPHLASAIDSAPNRIQEAWELMNALSPKAKVQVNKNSVRKDSPLSPNSVPKGASINEGLDVMNMSDEEFRSWRKTKRKK